MIKTDDARSRAVMSAVYLVEKLHMMRKQMTVSQGDHNVPFFKIAVIRATSEALSFGGTKSKGQADKMKEGKI